MASKIETLKNHPAKFMSFLHIFFSNLILKSTLKSYTKAPSLRKGAPSTVTWEKEQRPGSFNIDFSKNHLGAKDPLFWTSMKTHLLPLPSVNQLRAKKTKSRPKKTNWRKT